MNVKWCPGCRREIPEPDVNPISNYAKFWRNECYICGSRLHQVPNPLAASQATAASAERDKLKAEVDRLRFEYEKRQRNIQVLQTKLAESKREEAENEESLRRYRGDEEMSILCLKFSITIRDKISDLYTEIGVAEKELAKIQQALDRKA